MNSKSTIFLFAVLTVFLLLCIELFYLKNNNTTNDQQAQEKMLYLSLVGLPDLAFASETRAIRNRSLGDSFSIFNEGPEIRDFFPASFVYSPSPVLSNQPSRIILEK